MVENIIGYFYDKIERIEGNEVGNKDKWCIDLN
jgi:hypothetical protein